jgi:hypothetical protein
VGIGGGVVLNLRLAPARRVAVVGVVTGIAAVGLTVGPALAEDAPQSTSEPTWLTTDSAQPAPIGAVQPEQAQTLRVLRRARKSSDALPAGAQAVTSPARYGRNPQLARAIKTRTGKAWVVPGDDVVCLVMPDPIDGWATTCAGTDVVATQGLTLGLTNAESSEAVTLVPDGATVTSTDEQGRTATVTPDSSGAVAVDPEKTASLAVETPAGEATTPMQGSQDLAPETAP